MFGTSTLFAAFQIVLILSTLITCCVFKDIQSRVTIGLLAVLTGLYVAGPAVEFMEGYILACQMIADYIVVFCGPAGSVLLIMAVPTLMFFIPAPPCKEEDQCCEDGCKSRSNPSGYCDDCYIHPDRMCPTCNEWGDPCFEAGECITRGLWKIEIITCAGVEETVLETGTYSDALKEAIDIRDEWNSENRSENENPGWEQISFCSHHWEY